MEEKQTNHNTTRMRSFGYFITIVVTLLIITNISTTNAISGCAGDCMTCHPVLVDSKDHQSLKTCILCHNNEQKTPQIFPLANTVGAGCGNRCFICHSEWPLDSYHQPLDTCLQCHEK